MTPEEKQRMFAEAVLNARDACDRMNMADSSVRVHSAAARAHAWMHLAELLLRENEIATSQQQREEMGMRPQPKE